MKTKQLHGRMLEIASGESELTLRKVIEYREAFEKSGYVLPPLDESKAKRVAAVTRSENQVSHIGDYIKEQIVSIAGKMTPCNACNKAVLSLNAKTPDEVEANKSEVVRGIIERSRKTPKFWQRLAVTIDKAMGTGITEAVVGSWIESAIAKERSQPYKPKRRMIRRSKLQRGGRTSNSPTIPDKPLPFTGSPRITLMFHVWPRGDGWKRHIEKLEPLLPKCHRLLLGVSTDSTTHTLEETTEAFGDRWEVFHAENKPPGSKKGGLREVATYNLMLPTLSSGQNDITICLHGKGAQVHNEENDVIKWWIDAMYETVAYNVEGIIHEMEKGAAIVGSFRRHGKQLGTRHKWHYSGTYYAFRNAIAFSNGVPTYRQIWWGTESWPGDHFPVESSACLFGDRINDLYKAVQQPRAELEQWKSKRANQKERTI